MLVSDKEGMIHKVISLLFFALVSGGLAVADAYSVEKGDTSATVAQKKHVPEDVLLKANTALDWSSLRPGDTVVVPDRYTVRPGDTLYSLGRQWGVDVAAIVALNSLGGPTSLKVGKVLYVPDTKGTKADGGSPEGFWPVDLRPRNEGDKLKSVTFGTSGEPFRSVSAGTVVFQGEFRGVGRVLMVQREDKTIFAYGNFETSTVAFGQSVAKGQILGTTSSRSSQRLELFAFRQSESLDIFSLKR